MKKLVALILAVMMLMSLTAAFAEKTPTIAYVPKVIGQPWWDYVQKNVEEWGAENGFEVIYKGPADLDAAAQVQIMTDLVNQGVDILCFSAFDPNACEEVCKQALEKGIIVIGTESAGMENITYDVEAHDDAGLGAFLMDQLAKQMGEEGEYITMVGSMTQESQNNWADGAVARQKEAYPNMTLVEDARVSSESDQQVAFNRTKELKEKYPNLKGILGTSSFDGPGAAKAIADMGLTGQMFAISVALPSEVGDLLDSGVMECVGLWDPGLAAKAQLNAAMILYNGGTIENGTDLGIAEYSDVKVEGKVIIGKGDVAITAENWESFGF